MQEPFFVVLLIKVWILNLEGFPIIPLRGEYPRTQSYLLNSYHNNHNAFFTIFSHSLLAAFDSMGRRIGLKRNMELDHDYDKITILLKSIKKHMQAPPNTMTARTLV